MTRVMVPCEVDPPDLAESYLLRHTAQADGAPASAAAATSASDGGGDGAPDGDATAAAQQQLGGLSVADASSEATPMVRGAGAPDTTAAPSPPAGEATAAAAADMSPDVVIEHCLLAGLHSLPDSGLPILTSDFYSKHMLPHKPPGARESHCNPHMPKFGCSLWPSKLFPCWYACVAACLNGHEACSGILSNLSWGDDRRER